MKAYDKARINKQRVFYEEATETIRVYPENYGLAIRDKYNKNGWIRGGDMACKYFFDKIQHVIDECGKVSKSHISGECLAEAIARVVPGSTKNHGYHVWQQSTYEKVVRHPITGDLHTIDLPIK